LKQEQQQQRQKNKKQKKEEKRVTLNWIGPEEEDDFHRSPYPVISLPLLK